MKNQYLFFIGFTILLLFSCKKYPEDEKRYLFNSPKHRITFHKWKVEKFEISGADSTEYPYLQRNYGTYFTFKDMIFEFGKEKLDDQFFELSFKRAVHTSPIDLFPAAWDFQEKTNKKELFFTIQSISFHFNSSDQKWNIVRLDSDKLIIESIEEARKIRFEFIAQ